jgi:hypothetical protein
MTEDHGERTTGTKDEHYNLISVLYHALQGAENCDRYASEAEIAGDERLAAFFREGQGMQTALAERAKDLLGLVESPPQFQTEPETSSSQPSGVPPTTDMQPPYRFPPDGDR